jgi:hypothetical protein
MPIFPRKRRFWKVTARRRSQPFVCLDEKAYLTLSGLRLLMRSEMIASGKHQPLAELKKGWATAVAS